MIESPEASLELRSSSQNLVKEIIIQLQSFRLENWDKYNRLHANKSKVR